jgi:hypothetical protein
MGLRLDEQTSAPQPTSYRNEKFTANRTTIVYGSPEHKALLAEKEAASAPVQHTAQKPLPPQ